MKTLKDAWDWYVSTQRNLKRLQRLGRRYWNNLPEGTDIRRDDEFRLLEAAEIENDSATSLEPIDDLAVVVLFSMFESLVRNHVVALLQPEVDRLFDPILTHAAEQAIRGVREGSFFLRVLEPLKKRRRISAALIAQVDQVRKFRNWVAHGRRESPVNHITPKAAFERLKEFLSALGIAVEPEDLDAEGTGEEPG